VATSNTAKRTNGVYKGLRVYDLSPEPGKSLAVVGPDGADPRTLDPDNLPIGFRQVALHDLAHNTLHDKAEISLCSKVVRWRESHYVGHLIDLALVSAGATGEEVDSIARHLFDDLLDDLQCDVINFLTDRGYSVLIRDVPEHFGIGVFLHKHKPEQQRIIEKALEAAATASKSAYEEIAVELVDALRREAEQNRDAERLELFDEAVDLLRDAKEYLRTTIPSRDRTVLSSDIQKFLAKVAKVAKN
jgi:hypothetical protein